MKHRIKFAAAALAASGMAVIASPAFAVSYASGVRNTGGSNWEFVLNEPADTVTILRNGGNPLTLTAAAAGRHTFDMTGFATFEIQVAKNAPVAWTTISDATNRFTHFERPVGLTVNKVPGSPYFGTIYVANPRTNQAAPTVGGRPMGDGIYSLTADQIGVNPVTRQAETDPNLASLAKVPAGWNVGATTNPSISNDAGFASVWRMTTDEAGNLIVGDWSNANGGIKYASPDLTTQSGSLLLHQDGLVLNKVPTTDPAYNSNFPDGLGLLTNGSGQEVHGSIVSRPYVTGKLGQNLTVYAMDEDMSPDGVASNLSLQAGSLWKWNVGAVVGNYDQRPQLVINASNVPDPDISSLPPLIPNSTPRENLMSLDVGVLTDAIYSPTTNKWYITQNRTDGNQAGLMVISADGVNGNTPTLEWSSLQFTIDNGLDGTTDTLDTNGNPVPVNAGVQDVFRQIKSAEISPDGRTLFVSRPGNYGPVLTTANGAGGAILAIPLDAQGIPTIGVADGKVTNISSIEILSNTGATNSGTMAFDAAGNLYTTSNVSERIQVFSPGGNWVATTTSAGGFTLAPGGGGGLAGDFNTDGKVDGADFLVWQRGGSPNPLSPADLTLWKTNFGTTAVSPTAAAVPEPASLAMAGLAVAALAAVRRRNRS